MKIFLHRTVAKNKSLIHRESQHMHHFMKLLMKQRNTGQDWSTEDIIKIKVYLTRLAFYVPVLVIFLLPFGSLLLPVLAEIIDRREDTLRKTAHRLAGAEAIPLLS